MAEPVFYWNQGGQQHGPFSTLDEAKADIREKARPQPTVNLDEVTIADDFKTGIFDPKDSPPPGWPT